MQCLHMKRLDPVGSMKVAERFHDTLNAMMGRMVSETQRDWDLLLPYVMAAYRASVHQSTGPNYLLFRRETKAPADLVRSHKLKEAVIALAVQDIAAGQTLCPTRAAY